MTSSQEKCGICGHKSGPCRNKKLTESFFHIHFPSNFKDHLNVPCFARESLNSVTYEVLYVQTEEKELYSFNVHKKQHKTSIYGVDYMKFLDDYNMEKGDQISLSINNPPPCLKMRPLDKNGYEKERVEEEYVFNDQAKAVVFSKGMEPTPSEIGRINKYVKNHGIGLGAVFVHVITETDISKNSLHIPKFIASVLDIPSTGSVLLVYSSSGGKNMTANYYKSIDGRIRFRNGWKEFAEKNHFEKGNGALFMFHTTSTGLEITIDPIRY